MMPVFEAARRVRRRVAYAEGESERVLRAARIVVDERLARPVLVGRRHVVEAKIEALGLRLRIGEDIELFDPTDESATIPMAESYARLVERRGVPPAEAMRRLPRKPAIAAAMLLESGAVDAALCGGPGDWWTEMKQVLDVIPKASGVSRISGLSALLHGEGTLFFCDTHLNVDPTAEQIAEMTLLAADQVRRFGLSPKVALLSHSNFGASHSPSARKMRQALALLHERAPDVEVEGEMHGDAALSELVRARSIGSSALNGAANLLVMPSLDAANISLTLLSSITGGLMLGPLLLGMSKPVHVLVPSATTRSIVNMTALAVAL